MQEGHYKPVFITIALQTIARIDSAQLYGNDVRNRLLSSQDKNSSTFKANNIK